MKKLKLALATCLAALALPAAPVAANEAIPGTCYEIVVGGLGFRTYPCECLVGLPWVDVSPPPPNVTITFCHATVPINN